MVIGYWLLVIEEIKVLRGEKRAELERKGLRV